MTDEGVFRAFAAVVERVGDPALELVRLYGVSSLPSRERAVIAWARKHDPIVEARSPVGRQREREAVEHALGEGVEGERIEAAAVLATRPALDAHALSVGFDAA